MPGHSWCSRMLINIWFSPLAIPWWLEDSAAAGATSRNCFLVQVEASTKRCQTSSLGRGTNPAQSGRKPLGSPGSLSCLCHKELCKGRWVWICALYVSFHADQRRGGLPCCDALQEDNTEAAWINSNRKCDEELGNSQERTETDLASILVKMFFFNDHLFSKFPGFTRVMRHFSLSDISVSFAMKIMSILLSYFSWSSRLELVNNKTHFSN